MVSDVWPKLNAQWAIDISVKTTTLYYMDIYELLIMHSIILL